MSSVIDEIRREANKARSEVTKQITEQQTEIRNVAEEERAKVKSQALEEQTKTRKSISVTEATKQEILGQLRTAERKEQRKIDLPFLGSINIGTKESISDVEEESQEIFKSAEARRKEVSNWEKEALNEINTAESDALTEINKLSTEEFERINKAENEAITAQKAFEVANIEVAPDKWYDRKEWSKLTSEQQKEVIKTGSYTVKDTVYYRLDKEGNKTEISKSEYDKLEKEQKDAFFEPYTTPLLPTEHLSDEEVWELMKSDSQYSIPQNAELDKVTYVNGIPTVHYKVPVETKGAEPTLAYFKYDDSGNEIEISETEYNRLKAENDKLKINNTEITLKSGAIIWVPTDTWNNLTPEQKEEVKTTGSYTEEPTITVYSYADTTGLSGEDYLQKRFQTFKQSEWEKKDELDKLEVILGRRPTLSEYQYQKLIDAGYSQWDILSYYTIPGFGPGLGLITKVIPGKQKAEGILDVTLDAQKEWQRKYSDLKWSGAFANTLNNLGAPALESLVYRMGAKTTKEHEDWTPTREQWIVTGVSGALWTLPFTVPPAVRAFKRVFTKAKVGTYPFSEPAWSYNEVKATQIPGGTPRIVKTGSPAVPPTLRPTKVIGAGEVGMSESQFTRFLRARVTEPTLDPASFKIRENLWSQIGKIQEQIAPSKAIPKKPKSITETNIKEIVTREAEIKALWTERKAKWIEQMKSVVSKQEQLITEKPKTDVVGIGTEYARIAEQQAAQRASAQAARKLAFQEATRLKEGFIVSAEGELMPAGKGRTYILDIPIPAKLVATELGINTRQLSGTQTLTTTQVQIISKASGLTETQIKNAVQTGTLTKIISNPATAAKILSQTQNLTQSQTSTLQEVFQQVKTFSQTEINTLTSTQLQVVTDVLQKVQTKTRPAYSMHTPTITSQFITPKPSITSRTLKELTEKPPIEKGGYKFKLTLPKIPETSEGKKEEIKEELPVGTVIWKQGLFWKAAAPPYKKLINLNKPPTNNVVWYTGEGSAYKTIGVVGGEFPDKIDIDLGVQDIHITKVNGKPKIEFKAHGEDTDLTGEGSKTKGIKVYGAPTGNPTLTEQMLSAEDTKYSRPVKKNIRIPRNYKITPRAPRNIGSLGL